MILPLSPDGANVFGRLKEAVRTSRKLNAENIKKHNIDLILAATALTERCIIISADAIDKELRIIEPSLQVGNWSA